MCRGRRKGVAGGRMSSAEKKSGRRREREREMDARTRPHGSRASTSLSLLFFPYSPASPPVSPSNRAPWYPFCLRPRYFSCLPPRFLARDAAIRQFFFSDHLLSRVYSNRKWLFLGYTSKQHLQLLIASIKAYLSLKIYIKLIYI